MLGNFRGAANLRTYGLQEDEKQEERNDEDGRREKRRTGGGRMGNRVGKFEDPDRIIDIIINCKRND